MRPEQFEILSAHTRLSGTTLLMDAEVDFNLTDTAREALDNGVPLVLEVRIHIYDRTRWWWPLPVVRSVQKTRLQYHALSQRFIVRNLDTGSQESYRFLTSALHAMGAIRDFPLVNLQRLDPEHRYKIRLRAGLDVESLPTPMRLWAYTAPDWRMTSNWFSWPLQH